MSEARFTRISKPSMFELGLLVLLRPHVAAQILFWRILGKRVRAKGRLALAVAALPFATERRMARDGKNDLARLSDQRSARRASIAVHVHASKDDDYRHLNRALSALSKQSHRPVIVLITQGQGGLVKTSSDARVQVLEGVFASRSQGLRAALEAAAGREVEWLVPTRPALALTRHAIAGFAANIDVSSGAEEVAILFGDQGEQSPWWSPSRFWLKPNFDYRMFLSQDYVTDACAIHVERALSAWPANCQYPFAGLYELALSLCERFEVAHLNRVVVETPPDHWQNVDQDHLTALERFLGDRAQVERAPYGSVNVRWAVPKPLPSVSVIVATRDRVELLRTCVEGVLDATDYPALDLIVADNESVEPETLAYLEEVSEDPRVEVVRWPHPFNYSAINNYAAAHAKGELLCLLNNDIEVIEPNWLMEMVREACQRDVGAVGARLLYPDHSVQHAGVAIGIGNAAGHAHRGLAEGEPGYYAQALIARGASAVTGACLLVSKEHFDKVGGLDEKRLAVAYNDVDFCLKLKSMGLRNTYTPLATLIHHESKSRGLDFAPEHLERYLRELEVFQTRWDTTRVVDPWHHALLERGSEQFQ